LSVGAIQNSSMNYYYYKKEITLKA